MADKLGLFYHEQVGLPIRIAGTVGITGAAFLAGQTGAISYLFAPAALESPAPLAAKQWKLVEQRSRAIGVGVHVIGALFGFLAYREKPSSSAFKYYVISAVSLLSTVPYTFAVMIPTQKKLQEKSESLASSSAGDAAAEAGVEKAETTHALLDQWATLNLGRVVLMTVGAVSALWANVDAVEYVGTQGIKLASGANRMG